MRRCKMSVVASKICYGQKDPEMFKIASLISVMEAICQVRLHRYDQDQTGCQGNQQFVNPLFYILFSGTMTECIHRRHSRQNKQTGHPPWIDPDIDKGKAYGRCPIDIEYLPKRIKDHRSVKGKQQQNAKNS